MSEATEGAIPTDPKLQEGNSQPADTTKPTERRNFLKKVGWGVIAASTGASGSVGATVGAYLGGRRKDTSFSDTTKAIVNSATDTLLSLGNEEESKKPPSIRLFENEPSEKLKRKLGLTITDFIKPESLGDDTEFMKSEQLLPIFHPGIKDHREVILKMAKKYGHNPNLVAFIASIQSGGNAASPGGLFGITRETFNNKRDDDATKDDMYNPEINADCAMKALSDCIKNTLDRLDIKYIMEAQEPYHPEVYAQAIHELTYGAEQATLPFDEQSEMSQNNLLTIRSFFNTWRLAFNMRKGAIADGVKRMNDHEIAANIQSLEMNARMWAIANHLGTLSLEDLVEFFSKSSIEDPSTFEIDNSEYDGITFSVEKELRSARFSYDTFKEGNKRFTYPLNPWLRRHHATTPSTDITNYPPNANPSSWSEPEPKEE